VVLFVGVEDEGRDFVVDVVCGRGDGDDELVMVDLVRAEVGLLLRALARRELFVVVGARPALDPEEGIYEDDAEDEAGRARHVLPVGRHGR